MIYDLLKEVELCEIQSGILSVIPEAEQASDYDNKVRAYDLIVGNRFYNKLVWGNWPSQYEDYCRNCLNANPNGIVLDAGCGSLVFTSKAYADCNNKLVVLLDRSIGMLRGARGRIEKLCGSVPNNLVFIQGDIFDLPFKDSVFDIVMLQGLLHMFDEKISILKEINRVKKETGLSAFTSLVGNNYIGRKYLEILKKSGEVASVQTSNSLDEIIKNMPYSYHLVTRGNMVYAKNV